MVSKALARSRKITVVTMSLSMFRYHWFVASSKAVTVECIDRKLSKFFGIFLLI